MQEIKELPLPEDCLLFIYTPFCGTCHVARSFLQKIEATHQEEIFSKMNGSLFPDFMQENQIESVPCLLIIKNGIIQEKIYTFHSVANIYHYVYQYKPELFAQK